MNSSKSPRKIAELILERAADVPWPVAAYLVLNGDGTDDVIVTKSGDPTTERERARYPNNWIGVFTSRCTMTDVLDAVLATYGSALGKS